MSFRGCDEKGFPALRFHRDDAREDAELAQMLGAEIAAGFGPRDETPLTICARDEEGALICGVNGVTHWRWLYVRHLWVAPAFRANGLGRALMARAEGAARERRCVGVYLDTFDEGAAAFYERLGFARRGRIENFPPGAARIFLSKPL